MFIVELVLDSNEIGYLSDIGDKKFGFVFSLEKAEKFNTQKEAKEGVKTLLLKGIDKIYIYDIDNDEHIEYNFEKDSSIDEEEFVYHFNVMSNYIHSWAVRKGFWEEGKNRNDGEMLCLMHSEISEALEALRHGNPPDDKVPEFSGAEAELADCIIRILDMAPARGWRIAEAIVAKMAFNEGRPYKHGKEF